jgi:hypothetical protein
MNQPVPQQRAPSYPSLSSARRFEDVRDNLKKIAEYTRQLSGPYLSGLLSQIVNQINTQVQGVGADLASAATIIPTNAIHVVTGTATISTINAPSQFSGPIWLIAGGAWTTNTSGNISLATSPTVGSVVMFVYDYVTTKWYPEVGSGGGGISASRAGSVAANTGTTDTAIVFSGLLPLPYIPMVSLEGSVGTSVRVVTGSKTTAGFTARLGVTPTMSDTIVINYAAFAI